MLQDQKQAEMLQISSKYQEMLYEETVTLNELDKACRYLNQDTYVEINEERSANHLCGYPICSNSLQKVKGYKINKKYGLLNAEEHKNFCRMSCFISSEFLKQQISPEPLHFRKIDDQTFNIIPIDVDPEEYLEKLKKEPSKTENITADSLTERISEISLADIKIIEKDEQIPLTYESAAHDNIEGHTVKKVSFASSTKGEKKKKVLTNENWLEPEKNTVMPILSKFGKIVNFLNEIITFNTKEYILNQNVPKIAEDYDDQQRKSIFCQKILHQFGSGIAAEIEELGIGAYEFKVYVGLFK
ncbi:hypothetical protein HDV06_001907 [Boothiomyces sp. JEL0866]|nr:hypothetical protein HDV06_001907 [Boothiomyces sp. JEL0866]